MNKLLRMVLLAGSILVLIGVLRLVLRNKMNIHYAMTWILWGISMVIFSAFPDILSWISQKLGFQVASNAVFLIMIFLLYCMSFYIFTKLSKHNEDLLNLNYEIAVLKKKIEELENK